MNKITGAALIFAVLIILVTGCNPQKDRAGLNGKIASWTYKGMIKTMEGTTVKTKMVSKVITEWSRMAGGDMVKFPMRKGEEWGHECDFERTDHMYCYYVKDVKNKDLSDIKGVGKGIRKVYTITYRIVSSNEEVDYAEGIGIIKYKFVHHGTTDEEYWRLVEVKRK